MSKPAEPLEPLRPRALALLLLASGEVLPRQRARDQQADRSGLDLKRRVLQELAALDPEPHQLAEALAGIVERLGEPTGPTRAVARAIAEDWEMAQTSPEWVAWLLREAVDGS